MTTSSFNDLIDEAARRYRDLASTNSALRADRDRLCEVIEGLLGQLGKYVAASEIEQWRRVMAQARGRHS